MERPLDHGLKFSSTDQAKPSSVSCLAPAATLAHVYTVLHILAAFLAPVVDGEYPGDPMSGGDADGGIASDLVVQARVSKHVHAMASSTTATTSAMHGGKSSP